jgi:hypothetical protein
MNNQTQLKKTNDDKNLETESKGYLVELGQVDLQN